nr:hypothetical protein [uncultured Dysosmobacter sp.]
MAEVILHEIEQDCKGGSGEKDEKTVGWAEIILPKNKKTMQNGNFFSRKCDFFNIDTGWYNR